MTVMSKLKFQQVQVYLFNKSQQMRYLNQQAARYNVMSQLVKEEL